MQQLHARHPEMIGTKRGHAWGLVCREKVSDLLSTAWEIADSSELLLPPFGTLWPHDEDPIASTHECEVLRDEMPSPSRQPCTAELGTGVRDKFQSSLGKRLQQNQQRRRCSTPIKPPVVMM